MKTFKLHLIRHGLTQGNLDGIYMGGGLDLPLSEAGKADLRALAARCTYPNVGLVFTSPMLRATQTADILYPLVRERRALEDLRECRFGAFEGKSVAELAENGDFRRWMDPQSAFVLEGGESGAEFGRRAVNALFAMMGELARNNIREAACVTHGGVIMAMLSAHALPRRPYAQWLCDNGCGYTVQADAAMLMRDGLVEAVGIVPRGYMADTAGARRAEGEDG